MTTKKNAAKQPKLTRKQREEMRKVINECSQVSDAELLEMLKSQPKGQLSMNVILDALWPKFKETFEVKMPKKTPGMTDDAYQRLVTQYQAWTKQMKSIARFWYLCGTVHQQNIDELISILERKDESPEEQPAEEAAK